MVLVLLVVVVAVVVAGGDHCGIGGFCGGSCGGSASSCGSGSMTSLWIDCFPTLKPCLTAGSNPALSVTMASKAQTMQAVAARTRKLGLGPTAHSCAAGDGSFAGQEGLEKVRQLSPCHSARSCFNEALA